MSAYVENSAVATGLEKVSFFIPFPKKGNAKECSNYHTIALISHASKVMLKITLSVGHSNQGRKRSKRNPDRKRRSETLTVCR